jgi:DNA-binding NarL/FixJ family response regulator
MFRIAIIEDDPLVMQGLIAVCQGEADFALAGIATTHAMGKALVAAGGFDILVCDLGLPDGDGTDLIAACAEAHPDTDVLVLTMFADHHKVIAAIRAGARGYLLKDQRLENCVAGIREVRAGGSPISPIIARLLLKEFRPRAVPEPSKDNVPPLAEPLSDRETETLNLLSRGFTYAECADLLGISPHTVATHVKSIYRKLEVSNRAEALFEAQHRGMIYGR